MAKNIFLMALIFLGYKSHFPKKLRGYMPLQAPGSCSSVIFKTHQSDIGPDVKGSKN